MTGLHLVRHGTHGRLDRVLCGRMEGVGLSDEGRAQARRVAALIPEAVDVVYTSPLQRARETAAPLAEALGAPLVEASGLIEIDFGNWTGMSFDELHADPRWAAWNERRSLTRPPNGESLGEAQVRAARAVQEIAAAHPDGAVAAVCHSDVIKALVCWWLGIGLDLHHRLEISPASVTTVVTGDWGAKVLRVNALPLDVSAVPAPQEPRP